jgi:hypothetical protein
MGNRDLDRAVAEHLGYVISRDIGREYYTYMLLDPSGRPVEANYYHTPDDAWLYACPLFSSEGEEVFTVLDELRKRGLWWTINADTDGFDISIIVPANDPKLPPWGQALNEWTADGSTLPEVICEAALEALAHK